MECITYVIHFSSFSEETQRKRPLKRTETRRFPMLARESRENPNARSDPRRFRTFPTCTWLDTHRFRHMPGARYDPHPVPPRAGWRPRIRRMDAVGGLLQEAPRAARRGVDQAGLRIAGALRPAPPARRAERAACRSGALHETRTSPPADAASDRRRYTEAQNEPPRTVAACKRPRRKGVPP